MPGSFGPGMAIGGGGGLVGVIVLVVLLLGQLGGGGGGGSGIGLQGAGGGDPVANCQTGADANQRQDCAIVAVVNSVQEYWNGAIRGYRPAETILFDGQVATGCGNATSAVGPFYCPADEHVYLDLSFYDELTNQLGAEGGQFAEAYVLAHEYGHHVQHLLGTDERVGNDREGPKSGSVRLELQADCYAGVWARHALETGFIVELTPADIADVLDAAASVGDDRIHERAQGKASPESFTHGTAQQRRRWFRTGSARGRPPSCGTVGARAL